MGEKTLCCGTVAERLRQITTDLKGLSQGFQGELSSWMKAETDSGIASVQRALNQIEAPADTLRDLLSIVWKFQAAFFALESEGKGSDAKKVAADRGALLAKLTKNLILLGEELAFTDGERPPDLALLEVVEAVDETRKPLDTFSDLISSSLSHISSTSRHRLVKLFRKTTKRAAKSEKKKEATPVDESYAEEEEWEVNSKIIKLGDAARRAALAITECTSKEKTRELLDEVGQTLRQVQEAYRCAGRELNRLKGILQPPVFAALQLAFGQAGLPLERASSAFGSIKLKEANPCDDLYQSWKQIRASADSLTSAIARWAQCQLCPPVDNCTSATAALIACADEGVKRTEVLRSSQACLSPQELTCQRKLVDRLHTILFELGCKADSLAKEDFDITVFDAFWPPIITIRHITEPEYEDVFGKQLQRFSELARRFQTQTLRADLDKIADSKMGLFLLYLLQENAAHTGVGATDHDCASARLYTAPQRAGATPAVATREGLGGAVPNWSQPQRLVNELRSAISPALRTPDEFQAAFDVLTATIAEATALANQSNYMPPNDVLQLNALELGRVKSVAGAIIALVMPRLPADVQPRIASLQAQFNGLN